MEPTPEQRKDARGKIRRPRLLGAVCFGLLLTGCNSTELMTALYETGEYNMQGGLGLVSAADIYARGATGAGIEVAVFDTGGTFTHPDLAANYNAKRYFIAAYGSANDGDGHGTHVAGIIAATKDDVGMHGLAFGASVVPYKILDDTGPGTALTDATLAAAVDQMRTDGVMITNNSWGISTSITSTSALAFQATYGTALAAYRAYDAAGGVTVFAAGNNARNQPTVFPGLPSLFPDLEDSWLAVMAVDLDGNEPFYSNRCGVAADWCLAAPGGSDTPSTGGVYSTYNDGGYTRLSGTSMAAPHVSGAIAALKELFPSLSYKQIRDRLLETADSSGQYANTAIFGQGLMDLARASNPVGVTSLPVSTTATGAVVATSASGITLSAGAAAQMASLGNVLILDSFQRAPFYTDLKNFTRIAPGYVSAVDLTFSASATVSEALDGSLLALSDSGYRVSQRKFGQGSLSLGFGSDTLKGLALAERIALPHMNYRMGGDALGLSLGLAEGRIVAGFASTYATAPVAATGGFGINAWAPDNVASLSILSEDRRSAIGVSFASGFTQAAGWNGAGAFAATGRAVSLGASHRADLGGGVELELTGRLAWLEGSSGALYSSSDSVVASAGANLNIKAGDRTSLRIGVNAENAVSGGQAQLRVATGIDASGAISYTTMSLNQSPMMAFVSSSISLEHRFSDNQTLAMGLTMVQDGYGQVDAIAGIGYKIRF
jgi:hypothetical protein